MPIKIDINHPTIQTRDKIQSVTQNFMESLGLGYFQYLRCFADGSAGLLTNELGLIEEFEKVENEPVIFSSFNENHEQAHSYWFLWDEELPQAPVTLAREKCNVHHGITLVRRTQHYYDMIAVGFDAPQLNAASFYLNNQKRIERHIEQFDAEQQDLIKLMNKNPIALPRAYQDVNVDKICLTGGRLEIKGKHGLSYITMQELSCFKMLLKRFTYKDVAHALGISHRSVETYVLRVKERTGLSLGAILETVNYLCP